MSSFPYRSGAPTPVARSRARLIVTQGINVGSELVVDHTVKIVGRARSAHLVLDDPSVSRHHFHVTAVGAAVHFQVCDGAASLVRAGRDVRESLLEVGDSILVGNTVFFVAASEKYDDAERLVPYESATTAPHSLRSGPAADARAHRRICAQ